MKYPQEKVSNPRNTNNKKIQTHKIPTTKKTQTTHMENFWNYEIPIRKNFGTMK